MKGEGLSHEERIDRGRRAKKMLEDEVFQEAVDAARQNVITVFLAGPFDETRARAAWATHHALEGITEDLRRTMNDGEMAATPRKPTEDPPKRQKIRRLG